MIDGERGRIRVRGGTKIRECGLLLGVPCGSRTVTPPPWAVARTLIDPDICLVGRVVKPTSTCRVMAQLQVGFQKKRSKLQLRAARGMQIGAAGGGGVRMLCTRYKHDSCETCGGVVVLLEGCYVFLLL